jgi:hypothetical protein
MPSVFLREKGLPTSKGTDQPNNETGEPEEQEQGTRALQW